MQILFISYFQILFARNDMNLQKILTPHLHEFQVYFYLFVIELKIFPAIERKGPEN